MNRKVGKETERGSKKRKEVGKDNSLSSMYVCKSDAGMSVENVPTVVKHNNIERTIYCTQVLDWVDGGCGEV